MSTGIAASSASTVRAVELSYMVPLAVLPICLFLAHLATKIEIFGSIAIAELTGSTWGLSMAATPTHSGQKSVYHYSLLIPRETTFIRKNYIRELCVPKLLAHTAIVTCASPIAQVHYVKTALKGLLYALGAVDSIKRARQKRNSVEFAK